MVNPLRITEDEDEVFVSYKTLKDLEQNAPEFPIYQMGREARIEMDRATEFTYLRQASIAARGLWFDLWFFTEQYSKDGTVPVDRDYLAKAAGIDRTQVDSLILELVACGLIEISDNGRVLHSGLLAQRVSMRKFRERAGEARRQRGRSNGAA